MFRLFKMFKGNNHEQVKPTLIVVNDPIDKMVEKEMAQLKAIKDEEEQKEMSKYTKRIESLEELHQVIEALETLDKQYTITKKLVMKRAFASHEEYQVGVWYVEEVDVVKKHSDVEKIVKSFCRDCGTWITGKEIMLEGKSCSFCFSHNTTIVPLKKECSCK